MRAAFELVRGARTDDGGLSLIRAVAALVDARERGHVVLIEEPELYLSPHAQRHLYGLLRALAQEGNQILYSTHAPVFLSVDKLEELALVRHTSTGGTSLFQPEPLAEAESFRALSEFDSDRAELFLARCAVLVEGRTEKLTFPLVFDALGVDPDKEGILVLECGGKGNMPLFARVANACSVPYVIVHDRDAPRGVPPVESERVVNRQIREIAGSRRTVVLTPDFETVAGERRMIGDVLLECELEPGEKRTLAGFENHAGRTRLDPGAEPLGRVLAGFGNDGESGFEGCRAGRVVGTYLHGPLLPRNPWLADWLLAQALAHRLGRGDAPELEPLPDELEQQAHVVAAGRARARGGRF